MRDTFYKSYGVSKKIGRAKPWEWVLKKLSVFLRDNQVYVVFFMVLAVAHLTAYSGQDDVYFAAALEDRGVLAFLRDRYQMWSSRILIEGMLVFLARMPEVWSVLNVLAFVLAGFSLVELLSLDKRKDLYGCWLILGGFFLIPFACYNGAGWIATTLNYLWPCALALWALVPVKKILCEEPVSWWEKALSIPSLIVAANMELVCVFLLAVLSLCTAVDAWSKKRLRPYFAIMILLVVFSLLFILTCPGNAARAESETLTWFPEFTELSLPRKLEIGFSSTLFAFFFAPNLLFFSFSLLLFVTVCVCVREMPVRLLASIPLSASTFLGILGGENVGIFQELQGYRTRLAWYGTGISLAEPGTWMPDLFCLFLCGTILFTICRIFDKKSAFLLCFVLLAGFATRMAMSFSPTVWASGERTFLVMDLCLLFCMGAFARRMAEARPRYREAVFLAIGCLETFGIVNFWFG